MTTNAKLVMKIALGLLALSTILGVTLGSQAWVRHAPLCTRSSIHRATFPGDSPQEVAAAMATRVDLPSQRDDAHILAAFGFDGAVRDETVHGTDGAQAVYHYGENEISIVHSASTGLAVLVRGAGKYAGIWQIERCG